MKKLITVKVDSNIKEEAQRVAKDLGIPLGSIINGYLREFVRVKSVSFSCGDSSSIKAIGEPQKDIFRGVIIEESLQKKKLGILKKVKILGTKVKPVTEKSMTPWLKIWSDHTVEIQGIKNARKIAKELSESFDTEHDSAWYADYNNGQTCFIIFPHKIFEVDGYNQSELDKARAYGIKVGIPEYQVGFKILSQR